MSFNLQKYLTENNLTLISKIREDIDVDSEGPSKSDLKKSEKDFKGLHKKKQEYADLQKKVKDIIGKYTVKGPDGNLKLKDVAGYKKAVGNMPDRIKLLKKQIDAVENPNQDDEEDNLD